MTTTQKFIVRRTLPYVLRQAWIVEAPINHPTIVGYEVGIDDSWAAEEVFNAFILPILSMNSTPSGIRKLQDEMEQTDDDQYFEMEKIEADPAPEYIGREIEESEYRNLISARDQRDAMLETLRTIIVDAPTTEPEEDYDNTEGAELHGMQVMHWELAETVRKALDVLGIEHKAPAAEESADA